MTMFRPGAARRSQRGFTLIELVTVLAVIGILLSVALPAFTEQLRKSRRADAVSRLADMVLRQERFRAGNNSFGSCDQIVAPSTCIAYNALSPYYAFSVTGNTAFGYTLAATPRTGSSQENDRCGVYTFTMSAGVLSKAAGGSGCL